MPKTLVQQSVAVSFNNALIAAKRHGENSDPDHEVGDLQDMLRVAWALMTETQRQKLLNSTAVKGLIEQEL